MSKIRRGLSFALVFVMLVSLFAVMPASNIQAEAADASKTVSAWHTSMLDLNGEKASTALAVIQAMPNTSTYRSRLQMNAAGDSFRVTLTNYYGDEDLKVTHMTVARPGGTGNATSIDTATLKTVTVKGSQTFTIPRGGCGHPLYADSINSGDVDHCTYDIYAGVPAFSGMNASCEIIPVDGENNICYQVATPNELIFNHNKGKPCPSGQCFRVRQQ